MKLNLKVKPHLRYVSLQAIVDSRWMPMFGKSSNICCMDFFVLVNSIEGNTYHSHDVLLEEDLLITAVLVSWSLFLELVKRLAERLSVLEKTGLGCLRTLQIYQGSHLSSYIYIVHQPLSLWSCVAPSLIWFTTRLF